MPDQTPSEVKADRVARLKSLEAELRDAYYRRLLGRRLRVLVESPSASQPGRMIGTSCRYAPVELEGSIAERKQFVEVVARSVENGMILGERAC